jgi:putative phosphoribosyl transferase
MKRNVFIEPLGLPGILQWPERANALVVFAHGSGSSRLSSRNLRVADALNARGMATFLFDLLRADEEGDRTKVFDIPLLAKRLADAIRWLDEENETGGLHLGLFGASTGAAAALIAAAELGARVEAVVSRGGRPDLAMEVLPKLHTPTLLIVGGADTEVIALNQAALMRLPGPKALEIIRGASHLFSEPDALEQVIDHAAKWFERYLAAERVS